MRRFWWPVFQSIVLSLALSWGLASAAQTHSEPSLPTTLYHWTDEPGLEHFRKGLAQGVLLSGEVKLEHRFGAAAPELVGRPAFYAWTDPVTGLATSTEEIYALKNEAPPRLIRMKIRPEARFAIVESDLSDFNESSMSKEMRTRLRSADLVFHSSTLEGQVTLREWIILNPQVILEIETRPEALAKDLQKAWQELPRNLKQPERLHWAYQDGMVAEICLVCHEGGREIARSILDQFLGWKPRPEQAPSAPTCAHVFR